MGDINLRQRLGQQIMDICNGHPTADTLTAQADALATAVGGIAYLSGMSLAEARKLLTDLNRQMQTHVVANWGSIERGDH